MIKHWIRIVLCILMCLFLYGCASRKDIAQFKDDMVYIRMRLDALQSENQKMKTMIEDVNKSIVDLTEGSYRTKADLIAEMSSLKDRTQFLQSLLDDTGDRMSKLLHSVEKKASSIPVTVSSPDTLSQNADSTQTKSVADLDPKELYDAAYLDLSRSDYDLALQGFQEYLRTFPNSEYADNAQYWIGEIYYVKGSYERSFNEFSKVNIDYPEGDKVPASLLKMGYCLINLDDKAGARRYLNMVLQNYPNSPEADLARRRIEEL